MSRAPRRRRTLGQATAEYALVIAIAFTFIFAPNPFLPRSPKNGEMRSLFTLFIDSFDVYIESFHTVITLPVP